MNRNRTSGAGACHEAAEDPEPLPYLLGPSPGQFDRVWASREGHSLANVVPLLRGPLSFHIYYKWHCVYALCADLYWDPWPRDCTVLYWDSILCNVHHCFDGKFSTFDHHQI